MGEDPAFEDARRGRATKVVRFGASHSNSPRTGGAEGGAGASIHRSSFWAPPSHRLLDRDEAARKSARKPPANPPLEKGQVRNIVK